MPLIHAARTLAVLGATVIALGMSPNRSVEAVLVNQGPGSAADIDVTKLGPQVGQKVPDFALSDQNGRARTLSSLIRANGLVLVFVRSADW